MEIERSNRRSFLKLVALGGGAFVAGKFFNSFMNLPFSNSKIKSTGSDYKITETNNQFKLIDRQGNDLIVIDKNVG